MEIEYGLDSFVLIMWNFLSNPTPKGVLFLKWVKLSTRTIFVKAWERVESPALAGKVTQKTGRVPVIQCNQFSLRKAIFI
jgi:hypothetical protein